MTVETFDAQPSANCYPKAIGLVLVQIAFIWRCLEMDAPCPLQDSPTPLVMRLCCRSSVSGICSRCCEILPHDELEQGVALQTGEFCYEGRASKALLQIQRLLAACSIMASSRCGTRVARFQETHANIARRGAVNANHM